MPEIAADVEALLTAFKDLNVLEQHIPIAMERAKIAMDRGLVVYRELKDVALWIRGQYPHLFGEASASYTPPVGETATSILPIAPKEEDPAATDTTASTAAAGPVADDISAATPPATPVSPSEPTAVTDTPPAPATPAA